jgi:hypothetical protein
LLTPPTDLEPLFDEVADCNASLSKRDKIYIFPTNNCRQHFEFVWLREPLGWRHSGLELECDFIGYFLSLDWEKAGEPLEFLVSVGP